MTSVSQHPERYATVAALSEMVQLEASLYSARMAKENLWTWDTWREQVTMESHPLALIGDPGPLSVVPVASDTELALSLCRAAFEREA